MTREKLAELPHNKLLQSLSGSLILVVDRQHSTEALHSSNELFAGALEFLYKPTSAVQHSSCHFR
jgi:hypothetical protein